MAKQRPDIVADFTSTLHWAPRLCPLAAFLLASSTPAPPRLHRPRAVARPLLKLCLLSSIPTVNAATLPITEDTTVIWTLLAIFLILWALFTSVIEVTVPVQPVNKPVPRTVSVTPPSIVASALAGIIEACKRIWTYTRSQENGQGAPPVKESSNGIRGASMEFMKPTLTRTAFLALPATDEGFKFWYATHWDYRPKATEQRLQGVMDIIPWWTGHMKPSILRDFARYVWGASRRIVTLESQVGHAREQIEALQAEKSAHVCDKGKTPAAGKRGDKSWADKHVATKGKLLAARATITRLKADLLAARNVHGPTCITVAKGVKPFPIKTFATRFSGAISDWDSWTEDAHRFADSTHGKIVLAAPGALKAWFAPLLSGDAHVIARHSVENTLEGMIMELSPLFSDPDQKAKRLDDFCTIRQGSSSFRDFWGRWTAGAIEAGVTNSKTKANVFWRGLRTGLQEQWRIWCVERAVPEQKDHGLLPSASAVRLLILWDKTCPDPPCHPVRCYQTDYGFFCRNDLDDKCPFNNSNSSSGKTCQVPGCSQNTRGRFKKCFNHKDTVVAGVSGR